MPWVGYYRGGGGREGRGTKSRWLCHMCTSITMHSCMQNVIQIAFFSIGACKTQMKYECVAEWTVFVLMEAGEQRVSGFNQAGKRGALITLTSVCI